MTTQHRTFWSSIAQKYDEVVELQIGPDTRAMVRARLAQEGQLGVLAEFGCGTGFFTNILADKAEMVVATDLAPGMLVLAKQRVKANNVRFEEQDCQKTTFADLAFDTVFMSLVIHFTEPSQTIREMHRILKCGGVLIIANAAPGSMTPLNRLRWLARGYYYGITRHRTKPPRNFAKNLTTQEQLCNLLAELGFEISDTEYIRNRARSSNMPIEYIKAVKLGNR